MCVAPATLRIAARRSALARIQAQLVARRLMDRFEGLAVEFQFRESLGDQNQSQPLWQMPEKGVFTEDLRTELIGGGCDLVVHSWKDLPIETGPETEVVATLPRADAQDLLLVRQDRWAKVVAARRIDILTSSPRRIRNLPDFLREALPTKIDQVNFLPVRGNMQTRIKKMWDQEADGLILAKAALDRLLEAESEEYAETRVELRRALERCRWMVLPLLASPSAPAQGALAIEIAAGRDDLRRMLAEINCVATFDAVRRERQILKSHGGGCHQAIGVSVLIRPYGEVTIVRGLDQAGDDVSRTELVPVRPRPPRLDAGLLWSGSVAANEWFTREPIVVSRLETEPETGPKAGTKAGEAWWVAKADALPLDWPVGEQSGPAGNAAENEVKGAPIIWASGLQTWRRLAQRGIWVNGSAEGLGEQELPRLGTLAGRRLDWIKLSHQDAGSSPDLPLLATYRLVPRNGRIVSGGPDDLEGREYFFWTSGSSFRQAIAIAPWLREKTHFCGPGNTCQALVEAGIEPHVFLDQQQWLAEMSI